MVCKECGKIINDKVEVCPYCHGEILVDATSSNVNDIDKLFQEKIKEGKKDVRKKLTKRSAFIIICSVILVLIVTVVIPLAILKKSMKEPQHSTICAGSEAAYAVKDDGSVYSVPFDRVVGSWNNVVAVDVAAHNGTVIGLKSDGTLVSNSEGFNGEGNVGDWKNILSFDSGCSHTVGVKSNGTVVATEFISDGYTDYYGQCEVDNWNDIVQVACGFEHTVGLKSDGTVIAVGNNDNGQCNVSNWSNIKYIFATEEYTLGVKEDGTVLLTGGSNYPGYDSTDKYNEVVSWTNIVKVSAGFGYGDNCIFGLKEDGTVVAVGTNEHGQCNVSDWTGIVDISAGEFMCLGLKSDGSILLSGAEFGNADYMKEKKETIANEWTNVRIPGVNISKIEKVEDAYIDTSYNEPDYVLSGDGYVLSKDTNPIQMRRGPGEQYSIIKELSNNDKIEICGYMYNDKDWILIHYPEEDYTGWVENTLVICNISEPNFDSDFSCFRIKNTGYQVPIYSLPSQDATLIATLEEGYILHCDLCPEDYYDYYYTNIANGFVSIYYYDSYGEAIFGWIDIDSVEQFGWQPYGG